MSTPLSGCRILITRAADQTAALSERLLQRGAAVVECPTIQLVPPETWDKVDAALSALAGFDWLILTSANGVRFFFGRLQELGIDPHSLYMCKICAVGPKTAEALALIQIKPDLVPEQFTGEGVVSAFQNIDLKGKKVLFPKADGARGLIPQKLAEMGALIDDPVVYRNVMPQTLPDAARQALDQHLLDVAVFSSPSTVRNLAILVGGADQLCRLLTGVLVASIGPVTSKACLELGLEVAVEAGQATLDGLIQALERQYQATA